MIVPTIRTIIADAEGSARQKLMLLLNAEDGVRVVGECDDGKQTISAVVEQKPDLLFLDIHLPDLDGFAVLDQIPSEHLPFVIITATHDNHAVRAFEAGAFDYLLKPYSQDRVHLAIDRVCSELLKSHEQSLRAQFMELLNETKPHSTRLRRLAIRTAGRVVFLDMNEIDWIEAAANYVRLHVGKDSFLLREGIGRLASKLDPDRFVRIHRSSIVNVNRIRELQPCDSGEYIAVLRDGKELSCSRGCRPQLLRLIEGGV